MSSAWEGGWFGWFYVVNGDLVVWVQTARWKGKIGGFGWLQGFGWLAKAFIVVSLGMLA